MGIVRSALVCPFAFLLAACGQAPPPVASPESPAPSSTAPVIAVPRLPDGPFYVLVPPRGQLATNPSVQVSQGHRFETTDGQLTRAQTGTEPALAGYHRVPETHGGGFLFYNDRQLFRAASFTGELTAFADVGDHALRLDAGPGFFLVLTASGSVVIDSTTGQRKPLPLVGLTDVVADTNGHGLALDQMERAFAMRDGKTWEPVDAMLPSPAHDVSEQDGKVYFRLETGVALLDEQGQFVVLPRLSTPIKLDDPRWSDSDAPWTRAARAGVRLSNTRAAAPVAGSIATVDLFGGELLDVSPTIVAGARQCQFLEAKSEPLLVCKAENFTVLTTPLSNPTIEKTFPSDRRMAYALGRLSIDGGCAGASQPGRVCVRSADGKYQDFDQSQKLQELGKEKELGEDYAFTVQWTPSAESALGVIESPLSGLIDAATGAVTVLPDDSRSAFQDVMRTPYPEMVSTSRVAFPEEGFALRGFAARGGFAVAADGEVLPSPHVMTRILGSGSRAIGFDKTTKMFESIDYGKTWHEVEPPPGDLRATECSPLGCAGQGWLRIGWGKQRAEAKEPLRIVGPKPIVPRAPLPTLTCHDSGPPRVKRVDPWVDTQTVTKDLGFGANNVILAGGNDSFFRQMGGWSFENSYLGLVAMVYGRQPSFREGPPGPVLTQSELLRPKSIFYTAWFDPSARSRTTQTTWQAQLKVAERVGGARPSLEGYDRSEIRVMPVVAAESPEVGLLVQEETALTWIASSGRTTDLSMGRAASPQLIASASWGDQVSLLVHTGVSPSTVMSLGSDRSSVVLSPRGTPDVLAIRSDGTLAAGYLPVGPEPPSQRDPLQLVSTGSAFPLAEWSTLKPANAPECAPAADDYRFTLRLESPWMDLVLPRVEQVDVAQMKMLALFRANAQRFCIEGVEITGLTHMTEMDSVPLRVVATFTGESKASLVGITLGWEHRQDLVCKLESP